jgi:hypothetical protein
MSVVACKQDPIATESQNQVTEIDTSFWPLVVGNEWRYVRPINGDSNIYFRVVARRIFEDTLAFYLVTREGGLFHSWDTLLLRYRERDVIERLMNGKRVDYISFRDTNRSEFDKIPPAKVDPYKAGATMTVPAGTFTCTTVVFGGAEAGYETYSRGQGLIEYDYLGHTLWLLSSKLQRPQN